MAGIKVKISAIDELSTAMDKMASAAERALSMFDELSTASDRAFSSMNRGADEIASKLNNAATYTDNFSDSVDSLDQSFSVASDTMESFENTEDKVVSTLEEFTNSASEAENALENYGEANEEAGKKAEKFGKQSEDAVMTLNDALVTAGVVVALKAIADSFSEASEEAAEFEVSVSKLTTVADTSILTADELSGQINDVSRATAQNVNALADSAYNAISAGVDTANALDTVTTATELAVAGFTNTESALSVLTTSMNAYHLEASELEKVSDSLIMSQNLGVMTIDQLSSSMGKAIATASAYSVDLYNLEAAYISTTKGGISVEESTTYLSSMFKELGTASSDEAKIIQEETGQSFGQLMQEGYNVADVLDILYQSVQGDAEALMNLWGSAEAGKAANAVINQGLEAFAKNLDAVTNSAGTTEKAYETMTSTADFASQRMENSLHNLAIEIGADLNPSIAKIKNSVADLTDKFADFIEKHPAFTAAATALTGAIAVTTIGLGGYALAMKGATIATAAWTAILDMNPVFLAITAVVALTTAVVAFTAVMGESEDEYHTWTYATRQQHDELESLTEEYESACDTFGEMSEEAMRLKYQMDSVQESFEQNTQTIDDFLSECDDVIERSQKMVQEYDDSIKAIHENEIGTYALIQRLEDLATSTDNTAGKQMEMEAIISELNESVGGLNLSYGDLIENQAGALDSLKAYAEAQARQERMQEQYQTYVEAIKNEAALEEKLAANKSEMASAQEAYNAAEQEYLDYLLQVTKYDTIGMAGLAAAWGPYGKAVDEASENLEKFTAEDERLNAELAETQRVQAECEAAWEEMSNATQDATAASDGYSEAIQTVGDYKDQIMELCEAYDAAYQSALDSISGQYSLWDKADEVVATSKQNIEEALQSQIDYWTSYNDNLNTLTAKADQIEGLSDMLADLSDGSADSAAMLAGLKNLNDADLTAVVQQYSSLQEAQSSTATSIAELETDFADKLDAMQTEMADMVDGMNLSTDAAANAKATMDAYVSEIEAGIAKAQSAIDSLSFADKTLSTGGFHQYAEGTLDAAPGLALVGEEGPELVNFGGGEVVYTASETADVLTRSSGNELFVAPEEQSDVETGNGDKTITLKIEGAGEMKVGGSGGVSKEDVVGILLENVKDALMNIIQQEILEEGDMAYEF